MKRTIDPEFDPAINPAFVEPPFLPTTLEAARHLETGLVWWRPNGVISETPNSDTVMVRQG